MAQLVTRAASYIKEGEEVEEEEYGREGGDCFGGEIVILLLGFLIHKLATASILFRDGGGVIVKDDNNGERSSRGDKGGDGGDGNSITYVLVAIV